MAFDGVTIANVVSELKKELMGGRLYKIAQPEADELLLSIKKKYPQYIYVQKEKLQCFLTFYFPHLYIILYYIRKRKKYVSFSNIVYLLKLWYCRFSFISLNKHFIS